VKVGEEVEEEDNEKGGSFERRRGYGRKGGGLWGKGHKKGFSGRSDAVKG